MGSRFFSSVQRAHSSQPASQLKSSSWKLQNEKTRVRFGRTEISIPPFGTSRRDLKNGHGFRGPGLQKGRDKLELFTLRAPRRGQARGQRPEGPPKQLGKIGQNLEFRGPEIEEHRPVSKFPNLELFRPVSSTIFVFSLKMEM